MIKKTKNFMTDLDWRCPICFSTKYAKIEKYNGRSNLFKHRKLVTCSVCTGKSIYPMVSEKDLNYYSKNYWVDVQSNSEESRKLYYAQAESRVKYLNSHLRDLSKLEILDIGAGQGFIFDILKSKANNVNYSVVEIDENIHSELRQKGINNIYSSWKEIKNQKFDLIILSHIIEHFREPTLYLKEIKALLKKDRYIFIEVPNQDDIFKEYLGAHLIVFNKKCLKRLVKQINMEILELRSVGRNIESLKPHLTIKRIKNLLKTYFPDLITIRKLISRKIINKIIDRKKRSNNYVNKYKLNEYDNNGQWLRSIIK